MSQKEGTYIYGQELSHEIMSRANKWSISEATSNVNTLLSIDTPLVLQADVQVARGASCISLKGLMTFIYVIERAPKAQATETWQGFESTSETISLL